MANCKLCNQAITWLKAESGWKPMDKNGADHRLTCSKQISKPSVSQDLAQLIPRYKWEYQGDKKVWHGYGKRKDKGKRLVEVRSVKHEGKWIYYLTELLTGESYSIPLRGTY